MNQARPGWLGRGWRFESALAHLRWGQMIAVNLFDLACFMQAEPLIGSLLFPPATLTDATIEIGSRIDAMARPFAEAERGRLVWRIFQQRYPGLGPVRFYERTGDGWRYVTQELQEEL